MYRPFGSNPRVDLLKSLPIFSRCTDRELRRIASLTSETSVEAGQVLTVASEPGLEFFVIISGTATVWRRGVRIDEYGPGSFFGEMALFSHGVRTASVIANTDMHLLVSAKGEFRSPDFLVPSVLEKMLVVMSQRLCRAVEGWTEVTGNAEQDCRTFVIDARTTPQSGPGAGELAALRAEGMCDGAQWSGPASIR